MIHKKEKLDQIKDYAVTAAILGGIGFVSYGLYKCYKKKKRLDGTALVSCLLTGGAESIAETGVDLAKYAWKKGLKPVSEEIYKKGLKPVGKGIFNKALKPGYRIAKNVPKKLEHGSQKALKKTGKGLKSGLKKVLRFGF